MRGSGWLSMKSVPKLVATVFDTTLNLPRIPGGKKLMTSNIALELGYASGKHQQALFATGVILFAHITDADRHNIFHRNAERLLEGRL